MILNKSNVRRKYLLWGASALLLLLISVLLYLFGGRLLDLVTGKREPVGVMYHLISDRVTNETQEALFVSPYEFEAHLTALNEAGYTYLFADEYEKSSEKTVVITFDDGYEDNYTDMFPILKRCGGKATVFVIVDSIGKPGYLSEEQMREMAESGCVRFGSHTVSHPRLTELDEDEIRAEFAMSKERITEITGVECDSVAYPFGDCDGRVKEIAKEYFDFGYLARRLRPWQKQTDLGIPRCYAYRGQGADAFMSMIRKGN